MHETVLRRLAHYHSTRKNCEKVILRTVTTQIKFSGSKQTEVELLIYFRLKMKKTGIPRPASSTLGNLYLRQYQKTHKTLASLHEDLQADYADELRLL